MRIATQANSSQALRVCLYDARRLETAAEIDQFLCDTPSWLLAEMGCFLGLRLPTFGGDKPAVLTSVLLREGKS